MMTTTIVIPCNTMNYDYRLCSDVEVSKQVVELEGVNCLVRLCKEERERNHSDGVLVACLVSKEIFNTNAVIRM